MNSSDKARTQIDSMETRAFSIGVLGIILAMIFGWMASRNVDVHGWQQFFRSYILAYVYWVAISLGCLAFLMLHHVTGGWWGLPLRRILEAGSRTLPFMAVLFIPVLIGMSQVYPWMWAGEIEDNPVNHFKRVYLEPRFFTVRAIICFAFWILMSHLLSKWSAEQDRTADPILKDRMITLSAPGLVIWALTISVAAFDWVMSLEPHWYSTIYGMLFMVIECLVALSFSTLVLRFLSDYEPLKDCVPPKDYIDIGSLLLAFVMLWAYMSFSQFLIIWAGNLKNEIPWYMTRAFGGWAPLGACLIILHFFVPFFLLLQRVVKRRLHALGVVAGLLMVLSLVDIYWLVVPSYEPSGPRLHWLDVLAVIGIGGLWVGGFFAQLRKLPLLPLHDPRFERALEHIHGD